MSLQPDDGYDDEGWNAAAIDSEPCTWCGGEPDLQECDDPIQCCDSRCDGTWHPCVACGGTGLSKHQVIW